MEDNIFGKRLKKVIKEKNILQKDLAAYVPMNANRVSYFIKGTKVPNVRQLVKMAEYLDVSIDYLVGLTPIQNRNNIESTIDSPEKVKDNLKYREPQISKFMKISDEDEFKDEYSDVQNDFLSSSYFADVVELLVQASILDRKYNELIFDENNYNTKEYNELTESEKQHLDELIESIGNPKKTLYSLFLEIEHIIEEYICHHLFASNFPTTEKKYSKTFKNINKLTKMLF